MFVEYTDLNRAIGILLFFYLVGAVMSLGAGADVRLLELPRIKVEDGGNFLIDLLNGAIGVFQFVVDLLALPFGVVLAVNFGITALDVVVKSVATEVLLYSYLVLLKTVKDVLHPLR